MNNGGKRGARRSRLLVLLMASAVAASLTAPALARPRSSAPADDAAPVAIDAPRTTPTADLGVWGDFAPPSDTSVVITQPDGTHFNAALTPAETGGRLEANGYSVIKGADGWWRYATGVKGSDVLTSDARPGLDAPPAGVSKGAARTTSRWDDGSGGDIRASVLRQLQLASLKAQQQATQAGGPRVFRFPVLMLATWWDASKGQTGPQFQPGTDTPDYVRNILDGFGGNPRGSLTEFYFENSFGQFLVQVDVFGPFTSNRSRQDPCYYGGIDPPPDLTDDLDPTDNVLGVGGLGAVGMALEAVPQADPTVDFSQYDNDGDGYVDFMGIVHSGADMAVTGDPCNTWSHALPVSSLGDVATGVAGLPAGTLRAGLPTTDGVLVDRVFTMPEFDQPGGQLQIGVASHEMAHALGEPDYYAVPYNSSGDGDYDIMSGGSYLGNPDGSNPAGFNPATRVFQGWVTPKIIHEDAPQLELQPRNALPFDGYTANQPDPNMALVPTKWIKVGDTDELGHTWTDTDVYGLAFDKGHGYVIEGYYLENISRTGVGAPIAEGEDRAPIFDRGGYGGGLLTWHFDYWKRSNTYGGQNDGQDVPDRLQMDVEEWDQNDNTQELQLNLHRGEIGDAAWSAATGITSGTRLLEPGHPIATGDPQHGETWTGTVLPASTDDHDFTVDDNPGNAAMTVTIQGQGDCTLQLLHDGKPVGETHDSGSGGAPETAIVEQPEPGKWTVETGDFLACLNYTGTIEFSGPPYSTKGAADTWSSWTEAPTGWAFTNIGPDSFDGIDHTAEADNVLRLDVLNLADRADVSPGFAQPVENAAGGRGGVNVGQKNPMTVPIFSNGGVAPGMVHVTVTDGSGNLVGAGDVTLGAYERTDFGFTYTPTAEGPYDLVTRVTPLDVKQAETANDAQRSTGWAGPSDPKVLVVDDDGMLDSEATTTGALAALGMPYAIATRHVDAATMATYQAVVWESSIDRGAGQLDEADRAAIAQYLDGGGKLLLTSDRAAGALEVDGAGDFLRKYFGAATVDTDTYGSEVSAVPKGDLLGGRTIGLQPFAVRPFMDTLAVAKTKAGTAGPVAAIKGTGKPDRDGQLLGTHVDANAEHNGFQTVLLSFNLSQVDSPDDAVATLRAVLGSFGVDSGTPLPSAAGVIYHSTVRQQVNGRDIPVRATILGTKGAQLLYRHHRTGEYIAVPMTAGAEPGTWTATIPGSDVTPDGVDYFIQAGGTTDPRGAGKSSLAHTVSVAIS